MDQSQNLKMLELLLTTLGQSTDVVVVAYTRWIFMSALCWTSLALIGIYGLYKWKITEDSFQGACTIAYLVKYLCVFIFCIMAGCNIPDLVFTDAAAMHQLINDITIIRA